IAVGANGNQQVTFYKGVSGPTSFGSGGVTSVSSGSGNTFGVIGSAGELFVPSSYAGTPVSATDTFTGKTFANLGLSTGTYTYTWGSGPNADSLTLVIEDVPEPTSLTMLGAGVVAFFGFAWRRPQRCIRPVT
ncbi:MAG: PEP-CTERM sorting domain-containing protein, partial [Phycisphaerae bacterium]|nr:PEP-CTERM sorting domain-containing protein [Phycisphaerae bacterium]